MSKFAMKSWKSEMKSVDKQGYINYTEINNQLFHIIFSKNFYQISLCAYIRHYPIFIKQTKNKGGTDYKNIK